MRGHAALFVAFLAILAAPSCEAQTPPAPTGTAAPNRAVAFEVLARGADGPVLPTRVPGMRYVRSEADWRKVWAALQGGSGDAAPRVDFTAEMVVVVTLGERPTAGYRLEVAKVEAVPVAPSGECVAIYASMRKPKPDAVVAQVITCPWVAVKVAGRWPDGTLIDVSK